MRINQPETARPRRGVIILFVALSIVLITLWFREGDGGVIHRVRGGVQTVAAPVSAAGEYATRPLRGFFVWAGDLGVSRSQLEELRSQNTTLRSRVAQLEEARLENVRLRELVKLSQASELQSIGARVIGRPTNSWEGVITIDRGTADGVRNGMPVVGPQGLLGQTISVTNGSSKVRLITDQRSGVAALVQDSRATGIVRGSIEGGLTLEFVNRSDRVKAGDVVITSGLGGVYPKGLVVGEVTKVERDPSALYQRIEMTPSGDIQALEEVLVLTGVPEQSAPQGGE
ncbi:MAG TPA: rod shape-determining protein MreC [Coriobacteriia bacterium]|nr:rod shape-determining protein MreC [Coriobacteriia bacterium]